MKTIVITGSTRGIGYGLADELLKRGCNVVISGRTQAAVEGAVAQLAASHDAQRSAGQPCDVTDYDQVQALWDAAAARFGRVDVWINNAGLTNLYRPPWEQPPETISDVISANVIGLMYGCKVAYQAMQAQGGGFIYNMSGSGADGRARSGLSIYASSKAAVVTFTRGMIGEMDGTAVKLGLISPGMVATDLVIEPLQASGSFARSRRVLSAIVDRVETITPWIAEQVLANQRHGANIRWLNGGKVLWRFLTQPLVQRDPFAGLVEEEPK